MIVMASTLRRRMAKQTPVPFHRAYLNKTVCVPGTQILGYIKGHKMLAQNAKLCQFLIF